MMGKPMTKEELLSFSQKGFEEIKACIDQLSAKERLKEWKTSERDKNIRDVIYHLHAWHILLIKWLDVLLEGGRPELPASGYTWDHIDHLNHDLWLEAQKVTFMDTLERFDDSHNRCMRAIEGLSEDQIFKPSFAQFNRPIIGLIDGCMAEHYLWALTKIKTNN